MFRSVKWSSTWAGGRFTTIENAKRRASHCGLNFEPLRERFARTVESMHIKEVRISPRSPWQNPYAERVIGSIRRECLDHMIIIGERHLRRILGEYVRYYNESRCHRSLNGNAPVPREVEMPSSGKVIGLPVLGGLHHRYSRAA